MEIYTIKDVSFTFPEKEQETLSHISLSIESGEFITICGKSGCGKSTLLRQLKTILTPHGKRTGEIYYGGQPIEEMDQRTQASEIGFVLQNPDNQIVTDKVWHELAFGLESLGYDQSTIRLRVAEMASFFGIQTWFHKNVSELSGGQKQLLNLASIMAMHPSVLILDEPTSQLDPIAAADFLETVKKINRDLGTTIIMTEHRLEDILPISDRLIVMDAGVIIADDSPHKVGETLSALNHPMFCSMPSPMQIYAGVDNDLACPVTVKEGRQWLNAFLRDNTPPEMVDTKETLAISSRSVITFKDVWFKYEKSGPDIIKDLSFEVKESQFYCIVGGNGTGKTSTLSLISGILQPYRGKVLIGGRNPNKMKARELFTNNLGILPQSPQTLFVKKTVEQDLYEMLSDKPLTKEEKAVKVDAIVKFAELEDLLAMHPYDLSGGEQQRAALAKVLLLEPRLLLLDEPTKGLDGFFKEKLALFLKKLNAEGVTIVMVSHDIEFCAKYAEVCAMFFDGSIITSNTTQQFFAGNSFYTTAANRMVRHVWPEAVRIEDVIERCQTSR
ncbi:ABC transporter ATP-binding protein [Paenibacillus macquariensis]|uniref:Energy-coupling factor transport system ATP-binding protein n=1 Tax=Paenibacillus macquariensis TaxID=948756 RepID=A0ABY1JXT3_9BACL|nr:ATP-binding cassette domain-containing protein [Paenibacillus macquariensis]MEC0089236.1 energy-coupling factor transporter ATPase [Paenibacillus macquariensis]OAB33351.1 cobalt ABC transporter ATP-binding protein [Paenibacillus macquariensis subsp. macquariensis]SIQ95863.1 energy-coupling factor transport system ATP-binding protein [Paenibacillus macquariensis]